MLGPPVAFEVDGVVGQYLDLRGHDGWGDRMLLRTEGASGTCSVSLSAPTRLRIALLDLPDGTTLSIGMFSQGQNEDVTEDMTEAVRAFRFERP